MNDSTNRPVEHISAILPRALKSIHPEKIDTFMAISSIWSDIVDPSLSDHVRPAAYKEPILIVHVNDSVFAHHLQFSKNEIIANINRILNKTAVTDIRCKIGPV